MTAFINGRALTNGEFVYVHEGVTYTGRAQNWTYVQSAAGRQTCTLYGVIASQQREEPPAPAELTYEHLTVTYVSYEDLPVEGAHNRLYLIFQDNVLLPCAYVYRPRPQRPQDMYCTLPYKPTNLSAERVRAAYPDGSLLPRWHTADITSHVCHRVAGDNPTWSTGLLLSNERVFADPALRCDITGETLAAPVRPTAAPAGPRGRLTVQILPWGQLPLAGDRDTLYIVAADDNFDEAAYVYRPAAPGDARPYKATNVSAAIVARLHDSGDQIPSQAAIARSSLAVPVRYVIAERSNDQLEVSTRDNFVTWMPVEWRLSEIPARSRPGHLVLPEVRTVLARWAVDEIDEVTRREVLQAGSIARNGPGAQQRGASLVNLNTTTPVDVRAAMAADAARAMNEQIDRAFLRAMQDITDLSETARSLPVVTYVSCLDELPMEGEEHRLYCIHGYEAAYIYRRDQLPPYRPTNLSAAALAENYADGATIERVPSSSAFSIIIVFDDIINGWSPLRQRGAQGEYWCRGRLFLDISARGAPLIGRRHNTAATAFTLPPGTAIPTRAIQGDPTEVTIPRLTPEQLDDLQAWGRRAVTPQDVFPRTPVRPADHMELQLSVELPPAPQPPHTVPGRRRLILD